MGEWSQVRRRASFAAFLGIQALPIVIFGYRFALFHGLFVFHRHAALK
jgi:hypothetical protein